MHLFKKILKISGFIFLGILVLLIIASFILGPIVKGIMEEQINEADQGQYSGTIENVDISILRGNLIIEGISLKTDTIVARENETPVIQLDAGEISVEGLSWLKFLLTDNLQMNRVSFLDLVVEAKVRNLEDDDPEDPAPFRWKDLDIYPMVKEHVDRIRLNDLRFNNIDLTLINVETVDTLKFDAEEFNLNSDDILIDADRVFTDARAFYASEIDIQGKNVKINREGKVQWQLDMDLIEFATRESDFGMLSENLLFFKRGESREDTVLFAKYREFNLTDLDLQRVQEDSVARIGTVFLTDLSIINNMEIDEEEVEKARKEAELELDFEISKFSLADMLPELLDKVSITEISLENMDYRQKEMMKVKGVHFFTNDLVIDKNPAFSDNRFLHAKQFEISIDSVKMIEDDLELAMEDFKVSIDSGLGDLSFHNLESRLQGEMNAQATLEKFLVSGMDTRDLLNERFAIDSIAIAYPQVTANMSGMMGNANEEAPANAQMDFYPAIEEYLQELQIRKIAIIQADIGLTGLEGIDNRVHLPALYVQISDLLIAEGTAFQDGRFLHTDDIAVRIEHLDLPLPDNVHRVNLDLFRLSTREGLISADGLRYDHIRDTKEALENPDIDQVFTVTNKHFSINNLDFASLAKEVGFYAGTIRMEGLNAEIFGELPIDEEQAKEELDKADKSPGFDIDKFTLADNLPEGLEAVFVRNILLRDINVRQEGLVKVGRMNLTLKQMGIDRRPAFAENRFLHTKELFLSIDTVKFIEQEEMLQISLDEIEFEMKNGTGSFGLNHLTAHHVEKTQGDMHVEADLNFRVTGIDTRELTDKILSIGDVVFERPRVFADLGGEIAQVDEEEAEEAAEGMELDLYPAIEDVLKELRINRIAIIEADFELEGVAEDRDIGSLPELNFEITDLLIAKGTAFEGERVFHAKDISLEMEKLDLPLPDGVYRAQLDFFSMSTGDKKLRMDGLSFGYKDNYKKIMEGPETNMVFRVKNEHFIVDDLEYGPLLKQEGFLAGSIKSEGLNLEVFVDNNYPAEAEDVEMPPTIQQLIKDLDMQIYLGDLSINDANIMYEELAEGGDESGKFTLEQLFVNVDKLTNVESIIGDDLETVINFDTYLMGDGHFKAELTIPMYDELQPVRFIGNIDSLDLTSLNRYTEYTTLFGFESGMIYTLLWDFHAGKELAEGIFGLSYENLAIQLSETDSPEPAGFLFQAGAYLANALVIDSDKSEDRSDPPKKVDFIREKENGESFIDHYIASIMAGFVEIMGFPLSIIDP